MKKHHFIKKNIFYIFLFSPFFAAAQNFQVHYDFGVGRKYVTTTFETFKMDAIGNTFVFVDFDFNFANKTTSNVTYYNPSLAYMEIARCFTLSKNVPLSAQIEYNGGFFLNNTGNGLAINNAFLAGLDYFIHSKDFSRTYNIKALYKYIMGKEPASFQITGVWNMNFFKNRMSFNGFADFWYERNTNFLNAHAHPLATPTNTKFVFISEPQLWWNITPYASIGTEVEMSVNFGATEGFKICPTIGAKYTF
ncbi:MAG TPA: DUF5020 family protein [Paludibacteraceae bacterium]|nr:DUF5020 family protein [Paludibacteraceae bacterium]HQB68936.1 DUF5020 family protein [Paludibacteraceae bacterium]HRS67246.1 DUF5020 family protein [Paludibacteraceae bacterium]